MKKVLVSSTAKPLLIFSDLHLGTRKHDLTVSGLIDIIHKVDPCAVVFNGDTFNFPCRKHAMRALNDIRDSKVSHIPLHFINGNHDPIFPHNELLLEFWGKKIFFEHGQAYSKGMAWLDFLGTYLNETCLKWFRKDPQEWMRQKFSKIYTIGINESTKLPEKRRMVNHLYEERREIIVKYSSQTEYQCVVTGHTHYAEFLFLANHVLYINSGCWKNYTLIHPTLKVEQRPCL